MPIEEQEETPNLPSLDELAYCLQAHGPKDSRPSLVIDEGQTTPRISLYGDTSVEFLPEFKATAYWVVAEDNTYFLGNDADGTIRIGQAYPEAQLLEEGSPAYEKAVTSLDETLLGPKLQLVIPPKIQEAIMHGRPVGFDHISGGLTAKDW